jgi:hypothetical protein
MDGIAKDAPKYRGTFDGLCKIALQVLDSDREKKVLLCFYS